MKYHSFYAVLLGAAVLLSGCVPSGMENQGSSTLDTAVSNTAALSNTDSLSNLFSDRDLEIGYDEETAAHISLTGGSASSDSDAAIVDGGTITITGEGTYILTGTLDDGMIVVNAGETDKVQLVLDNVNITSATSAAIYVLSADKVFLTTAAGSVNTLQNGGSYLAIDDNNIDGVIFSKSDLTLNGAGSLTLSADVGHGVVTKDDLVVTSGTYEIAVAGHGLSGKDSVAISSGTFSLETGKDGIQSDNDEDSEKGYVYLAGGDYTITAGGDGVSASSWMQVDGGSYEITTGGGSANGETHTDSIEPGGMRGGQGKPATAPDGQPPEAMDNTEGLEPPEAMDNLDESTLPQTTDGDTAGEETASDTTSTKGFKAGTALTVGGGTFLLDCADDAFHCNGDVTYSNGAAQVSTGDDAFHADADLLIENGTIQIDTCYEGLEGQHVTIQGGTIHLTASDDGVNAAGDTATGQIDCGIVIAGGALTIQAGGDGLDANGDLTVSGGTILISAQQGGDSPLDYDGSATITGGLLMGTGISGMSQNFGNTSTQGSILLDVETQPAGSTVSISDQAGNVLASWESPSSFSSVVISCPELETDGTYTVTTGTQQTEVVLDGLLYGSGTMQPGQPGGKGVRGERP